MTEQELRQIVDSQHLVVYWAGPTPGSTYLLDTSEANVNLLTVRPAGQTGGQTRATYPQFATYVIKDAFHVVLSGGGNSDVAGFINSDGNSVFYRSTDPNNVFVGLRGADIEIQIFHPTQGFSLAIARTPGQLVPITGTNS